MTRTVLVTGVGGFVGSHVVAELLTRTDWHVIGVDSFRGSGEFINLVEVSADAFDRVTPLVHDLNVPFTSRTLRRLDDVDYVINVASRSHVDESLDDPTNFVLNNVRLALTVLELCRAVRPRRLMHVSTDEVHGPHDDASPFTHRPSSPYAASKAAQVDLVTAYARTYGVPSTVLSSANMFGERQMLTAFVPLVVIAALSSAPFYVDHVDGRPGERSYTYVGNVAARLVEYLTTLDDATRPTLDHLSLPGQRRVDNVTLASEVADLVGARLEWYVGDARVRRPGYDPTYPTLPGDWRPRTSFADGLARTVAWYVDERVGGTA